MSIFNALETKNKKRKKEKERREEKNRLRIIVRTVLCTLKKERERERERERRKNKKKTGKGGTDILGCNIFDQIIDFTRVRLRTGVPNSILSAIRRRPITRVSKFQGASYANDFPDRIS